jgi:plastocyanin
MPSPRRIICTVATVAALALPAAFSGASLAQETATMSIAAESKKFAPVDLRVAPGTTVSWTNNDPFAHTITSDDGLFDSGRIGQDETFSFTFTEPGVYQYYCRPHGGPGLNGMSGTIVVEAPLAVEAPEAVEEPTVVDTPGVVEEPAPEDAPAGTVTETTQGGDVVVPEGGEATPMPSSGEMPDPNMLVGEL